MGKQRLSIFLCALLLQACATTFALQELREVEPVDSPFHAELAHLYLQFSENEADQYDWYSSQLFAEKGLMVAYGNNVEPENPADWDVGGSLEELLEARDLMEKAMRPDVYATYPRKLAQAHFYYDCWVEQQEEAWQSTDIELCRTQFFDTLTELQVPPAPMIAEDAPLDTMTGEPLGGPEVSPVITASSYLLFFPWDEAKIDTGQARLELSVMLDDLEDNPEVEVVINGHADRSGTDQYNLDLSQKRAEFVRATLIRAGVPAERIRYFAFGETDPAVPTPDGVREPKNRRVEIFIE